MREATARCDVVSQCQSRAERWRRQWQSRAVAAAIGSGILSCGVASFRAAAVQRLFRLYLAGPCNRRHFFRLWWGTHCFRSAPHGIDLVARGGIGGGAKPCYAIMCRRSVVTHLRLAMLQSSSCNAFLLSIEVW